MAEMTALQQKWAEQTAREEEEMRNQLDPNNMDESVLNRIPSPTGWRIVVLPFKPPKTTKSGLILAEKAVEKQQVATVCGYVVEVAGGWSSGYGLHVSVDHGNGFQTLYAHLSSAWVTVASELRT